MSKSQCAAVLALLRERGERGLTPLEALDLVGSFRLGARIWDLKQPKNGGHDIRTEWADLPNGKRVARYILTPPRPVTTGESVPLWAES